ncbi:hypothetical protein AVEN_1168-1 [Araneus ventricosus]|uniref:Uncharacterized protein n=1 Tax=Araneus ventricosus TaxID=182803 RepID=A0A4Y2ECB7_ARAVE|nr:hypothetical protein AVEN_1168-1 [Araneus ventricosus]
MHPEELSKLPTNNLFFLKVIRAKASRRLYTGEAECILLFSCRRNLPVTDIAFPSLEAITVHPDQLSFPSYVHLHPKCAIAFSPTPLAALVPNHPWIYNGSHR